MTGVGFGVVDGLGVELGAEVGGLDRLSCMYRHCMMWLYYSRGCHW